MTVEKLIPAELLVGKLDEGSPRNLNRSGDPVDQTIEDIKQASIDIRENNITVY